MGARRTGITTAAGLLAGQAAVLSATGAAWADDTVQIDLAGIVIRDGARVARDSAPDTIDPATRYRYEVSGVVQGSGIGLGSLFPEPTPLADALERLAPGSSEALTGEVDNPAGTHPFQVLEQTFEGETDIVGITVTFAATFSAGIREDDVAFFRIEDVELSPSFLVGELEFLSGTAVIERVEVACRPDLDGDGELTLFDFLAFQNAFDAMDPVADFDGDGAFTLFDFLAFQNAFDAGCP